MLFISRFLCITLTTFWSPKLKGNKNTIYLLLLFSETFNHWVTFPCILAVVFVPIRIYTRYEYWELFTSYMKVSYLDAEYDDWSYLMTSDFDADDAFLCKYVSISYTACLLLLISLTFTLTFLHLWWRPNRTNPSAL